MAYRYLNGINSPDDLRKLDFRELQALCGEIREFLIEKVSATGGHLSSNLGVIELTVALHWALSSPEDMILFDVGHQCYTHKLLTGRREGFDVLRKKDGMSGFPCPQESEHDPMTAGHGSAAISAAIGLARAKKLKNEPGLVVVVVGDGAFTGGMVYEGVNNVDHLDNLVFILNDNTMSISKNVGAFAHYLTGLRSSPQYYKAKKDVKSVLDHTPVIGDGMIKSIQSMKKVLRKSLYHSTFFEEMGLRYVGPLDGHDLPALCSFFDGLSHMQKPLMLHVETKKGKGFVPAENNPGAFHGVSAFNARKITDPDVAPSDSFSIAFGQTLARTAKKDERICAVTAAMKYGTGLQYMKKTCNERFFDVGMAEEHAVTFAAGLAAGGLVPVVAIYSTFLQRAYDQIIHDVMLAKRNVLFAVDRAGLVVADGETHQGIYDAAFLSQQRDMPIFSPANYAELNHWLKVLLEDYSVPRAIRYPRGKEPAELENRPCNGEPYEWHVQNKKADATIVTYGIEVVEAVKAAEALAEKGKKVDVLRLVQINPIPDGVVDELLPCPVMLFAEEGIARGGIGEHLALQLFAAGFKGRYIHTAISDINIDHAGLDELRQQCGLDAQTLAAQLLEACGKKKR